MADPSSTESPPATVSSERLTGILAGRSDLETWTPDSADDAQAVMRDVAAYCRDYCPARLACVEEACRLYRLESRSADILRPGPTDAVGVLGTPIIGL
jgi:hypothetical protein